MDFYDTWYKFLSFLILFLGLEPKTLCMLGKYSTTKEHLQPNLTKNILKLLDRPYSLGQIQALTIHLYMRNKRVGMICICLC